MNADVGTLTVRSARSVRDPITRRLRKAAILGLAIGVAGLAALVSFGSYLEESSGLALLFTLRGRRPPPEDVVVVSMDRSSSDQLGLPQNLSNWPRSYHARLIQRLVDAGASVIAFDVFFQDKQFSVDDSAFAKSIEKAGNVILVGDLRERSAPVAVESRGLRDELTVEQLLPPTRMFAEKAVSFAPFPLPKVPLRVSQFWTFKQNWNIPTLPVVVYQIYALQVYDDLKSLLVTAICDPRILQYDDPRNTVALVETERLLGIDRYEFSNADSVNILARSMKKIFGSDTLIASNARARLKDNATKTNFGDRHRKILSTLMDVYRDPDSRYLNFYGPPHTITTIPYYQALSSDNQETSRKDRVNLNGKIVFVGYSDTSPQNEVDFYNTVYSSSDGRDISGVEIAATAFANLRDGRSIHPTGFVASIAVVLFFGIVLGIVCYLMGPISAAICTIGICVLYLTVAYYAFDTASIWFPVMTTTVFQAPVAFMAAVVWKYHSARKSEIAHAHLREVDRLKTLFLSQVSHELRAPLSSIKGFVTNMLDGVAGDLKVKQKVYLHRVLDNTERLTRMITNLLDLSRIEAGTQQLTKEPCQLSILMENGLQQFEPIAKEKGLTLKIARTDPTLWILADHDKFVQIVTNLVDNAIKYTPTGGNVSVSLTRSDSGHALLTIADTGTGISADAMAHLFEPFYQDHQEPHFGSKGLGLGLSIVKTLVEGHEGTISVVSEPGLGSQFRILLPLLSDVNRPAS